MHDAIPESPAWSSHENVTVTALLFQPAPFAAGEATCVIVGTVLSIRTWIVWCASSLPALSTLQYESECTPSLVSCTDVPGCAGALSSDE